MDTQHLKLRGRTWYARLGIPPHLQSVMGKSEIVRSLHTRDLREAGKLKHQVLATMQKEIARADGTRSRDPIGIVLDTAQDLHDSVAAGEDSRENAELVLDATIERHLDATEAAQGLDAEGHPIMPEAHANALRLAHEVFHTGNVTLLSRAIAAYLKETAPRVRVATINEKRRQLGEFAVWLKADCAVTSITKKIAGRFVAEILLTKGHAPKTVKDNLSNLSAFFVWLEGRGQVETNPWRGMSGTVRKSTRGSGPKRRPWHSDELLKLLQALPANDVLVPLTAIAAYTGMRLEEIADTKLPNVTKNYVRIGEGKTGAAVRYVPVHKAIRPMFTRLIKASSGEYLLPGLLRSGADDKRGKLIGKRFGQVIRKLGFDDSALTFHTLRNAFMTRCEAASVPESTTKLLVGHARQSLTYGLYSPGVEFKQLAAAVAQISYGNVDTFVASIGPKLAIKAGQRSRRRSVSLATIHARGIGKS